MSALNDFKEGLAQRSYGMSVQDARKNGICIHCRRLAAANCKTLAGIQEFQISGLCEFCFDELFKEDG
jgi:hypothetical protein